MIKKVLLATVLLLFVTMPQTTQAQSEEEYRSYLLTLIELLQQQVTLLVAQQSSVAELTNENDTEFSSFLISDEDDLKARYIVDDPSEVLGIRNRIHRAFFNQFFTLVPDEYDRFFTELIVYEETGNDFDGFVETVPPYRDDTWRLGINESMFEFRATSNFTTELFVHEFAHIVSYDGINGVASPRVETCHDYYDGFDCPPANSYFNAFADEFWPDAILDEFAEEGDKLWSDQELQDDFVTDYAATAPGEDFAESFTDFVLEGQPSGSKLKDDKVRFFYEYSDLMDLREEIRSEL